MESCPVDETIYLSARLDEITYGAVWTHKIHEKQADIYELIGKALSLNPLSPLQQVDLVQLPRLSLMAMCLNA